MKTKNTTVTLTKTSREALKYLIKFTLKNIAYYDLNVVSGYYLDDEKFPNKNAELCLNTSEVKDLKNLLEKLA